MDEENIKNKLRNYLNDKYSDDFINSLSGKKPDKFFNALKDLDYLQVKKVLQKNPHFSNMEHDGWHALFYACLSNQEEIVSLMMKEAMNQGLTHFPKSSKDKKDMHEHTSVFNFCAARDLDRSYAQLLLFLSKIEHHDFDNNYHYAFWYHSPKVGKIINQFMQEDARQQFLLAYFLSGHESDDSGHRAHHIFHDNFKLNPLRFKDFEIDVKTQIPNKKNYFTAILKDMSHYAYKYSEKENHVDKVIDIMNFFMKNGFSLDVVDNQGNKPRDLWDSFLTYFKTHYDWSLEPMNNYLVELEKLSLANQLTKKDEPAKKKIKI